MRINGINNVNNVYKNNKIKKAYGSENNAVSKDSFSISDFARELQVAKKAVDNEPGIRAAKVDDIKARMEAGNYNITAAQIADKIIENL